MDENLTRRRITLVWAAKGIKTEFTYGSLPYPYQEPDAVFRISYVHQGFKNKTRFVFAIIYKERAEMIGEISLHLDKAPNIAQLAYWIGEPFWCKGIATEAAEAVIKFGFERLHLDMIYAECHEENKASGKVLLNNGMIKCSAQGSIIQFRKTKKGFEEQNKITV